MRVSCRCSFDFAVELVGVTRNLTAAAQEYETAAATGHVEAIGRLGILHVQGYDDVAPDVVRGVELLNQAAEAGSAAAYNTLACLYLQGDGVAVNHTKAFQLFLKACELMGDYVGDVETDVNGDGLLLNSESASGNNNDGAGDEFEDDLLGDGGMMMYNEVKINLASLFMEGLGTTQNVTKAKLIFQEAADFGYLLAAFNLALMQHHDTHPEEIPQDHCAAAARMELLVDAGTIVQRSTSRILFFSCLYCVVFFGWDLIFRLRFSNLA